MHIKIIDNKLNSEFYIYTIYLHTVSIITHPLMWYNFRFLQFCHIILDYRSRLVYFKEQQKLSWSWLYGSWIYNYLFNQCL